MLKNKRFLSLAVAFMMILGIIVAPSSSFAEGENVKLTIIGTTDLHANIYNYSYEDGKEVDNLERAGMAPVEIDAGYAGVIDLPVEFAEIGPPLVIDPRIGEQPAGIPGLEYPYAQVDILPETHF